MSDKYGKIVITGHQIRAARAFLNWSASETAEKAGLTRETVQRLERSNDIPASRTQSLIDLKKIFEKAGIEFIGGPDDGPGVRLWKI
jgi:transcriptional regulator with XRE-family HTH domain